MKERELIERFSGALEKLADYPPDAVSPFSSSVCTFLAAGVDPTGYRMEELGGRGAIWAKSYWSTKRKLAGRVARKLGTREKTTRRTESVLGQLKGRYELERSKTGKSRSLDLARQVIPAVLVGVTVGIVTNRDEKGDQRTTAPTLRSRLEIRGSLLP